MKIAIFFNCQHLGLANAMRALRPDLEIQSFELFIYKSEEEQKGLLPKLDGVDTIICPYLGKDWGFLSTETLRSKGIKVHLLSGISFSGYHPDTVYVNAHAGHYQAVTGPYHSRIALAAFLAGLSAKKTTTLYNKLVYARLGYLDAFVQSRTFLIEQFKSVGLDLGDRIDAWAAKGCFMHSLNHPKSYVLCDLAVMTCRMLGLDIPEDRPFFDMIPDNLAFHTQMPVYPEIAKPLNVTGHTIFKVAKGNGAYQFWPLDAYIDKCFEFYETGPKDAFVKANGVIDTCEKLGFEINRIAQ